MSLTANHREALLGKYTSRINKLWCAIGWKVPWELRGDRLWFLIDGQRKSKSYEQDYAPKLKLMAPRKDVES